MPIVNGDNVGAYAHGFPVRMMAYCINKGDITLGFNRNDSSWDFPFLRVGGVHVILSC